MQSKACCMTKKISRSKEGSIKNAYSSVEAAVGYYGGQQNAVKGQYPRGDDLYGLGDPIDDFDRRATLALIREAAASELGKRGGRPEADTETELYRQIENVLTPEGK